MSNNDVRSLTTEEKIKSVEKDYNDIPEDYANEFYGDTSDNEFIDKFLSSLSGDKVLDAGCGVGDDCKYMDKNGFKAYGIDLSEGMLKEAKERYPQGKYMKADMTKIPYRDGLFDGILANCSLFHVPSELVGKALDEFKRVLKPGGKLLLILLEGIGEEMLEEPYRPGKFVYTKFYTSEEITQLLKEHGFKVEDITTQKTTSEGELGSGKLIVFAGRERLLEQTTDKDSKGTVSRD